MENVEKIGTFHIIHDRPASTKSELISIPVLENRTIFHILREKGWT